MPRWQALHRPSQPARARLGPAKVPPCPLCPLQGSTAGASIGDNPARSNWGLQRCHSGRHGTGHPSPLQGSTSGASKDATLALRELDWGQQRCHSGERGCCTFGADARPDGGGCSFGGAACLPPPPHPCRRRAAQWGVYAFAAGRKLRRAPRGRGPTGARSRYAASLRPPRCKASRASIITGGTKSWRSPAVFSKKAWVKMEGWCTRGHQPLRCVSEYAQTHGAFKGALPAFQKEEKLRHWGGRRPRRQP